MKGFTKDGKFRPTGNNSGLKSKDIQIYQSIFDAIADPIIADLAPEIGAEALDCTEEQGGTYNFNTFECELP